MARRELDGAIAHPLAGPLAAAGRLHYGDVTVPIPPGATPRWEPVHPVYEDDGGSVWCPFYLACSLAEATAFYEAWVVAEDWRRVKPPAEDIRRDIPSPTIGVVKGTWRCGLFLRQERDGPHVMVRLDRTSAAIYDPTQPAIYHPGPDEASGSWAT